MGPLGVLFILPVLAVFRPRFSSVPFWRSSAGSSALRLACGAFPAEKFSEVVSVASRNRLQRFLASVVASMCAIARKTTLRTGPSP